MVLKNTKHRYSFRCCSAAWDPGGRSAGEDKLGYGRGAGLGRVGAERSGRAQTRGSVDFGRCASRRFARPAGADSAPTPYHRGLGTRWRPHEGTGPDQYMPDARMLAHGPTDVHASDDMPDAVRPIAGMQVLSLAGSPPPCHDDAGTRASRMSPPGTAGYRPARRL